MQLIEDACGSFDDDEGDDETSSTASLTNAAAAAAAATVDGTMSSKRQLQFMQLWGERRQLLTKTTMQPRQQQQQKQKQQKIPAIAEENKNQTRTISRTFVPSSAWRGLPGTNEVPANWSAKSGEVKMPNDKNDNYDEDEDDAVDDGAAASSSEEEEINEDKKEAECLARTDQIISDESAVSVQSLCEAAAAASTDRTKATAQREPSDIAAMLQNIRLGRRELYAEDSYAVRLERDLRAELRTELDRQQRLDARLDSLSLGDANEAVTTTVNENAQQGGGSSAVVFASEEKQQQNQPSKDSVSDGVGGVASSLAMRIKRRIGGGGGGGVGVGARDSGEPAPAPPTHEPENIRLDRVAKKSLQASAAARKRKKAAATALMLSRRRRDINSSSSSNSPSDSSSSESDPHVNNRCRWRKPRVSSSNISNSNCSNAVHSESGSSRSSQLDIGHLDDNETTADESNSSLPLKRPVYRAQGQGSPTKRPDSTALPTVSSRGTKLNVSEFEADPNQSVHLDRVYQSVEQLEPSGAVRIIDPRQMLADLDEGWPTDQLKSAPLKCEASSDSVAFKPKTSFTTTSGLRKSIENGGSPPTHATSSQPTHSPQPNNRQLHRQTQRQSHHQQNQEQSQQRENRTEEFAKPHNKGNSADPAKFDSGNRRKQDERGRMRSQLLQQPGHQSTNTKVSGLFGQDVELSKVFNDSELPVHEVAKRIVVHRRNQSEQSGTDQTNRPEVQSPVRSQQGTHDDSIEDFRCQSVDSDEVDSQPERFTSGHHGRISINNYKGMTKVVTLSRPATPPSLPNSTRNSAQIHHEHQNDAEHSPNGPGNNRNSSNRVRRLKNQQKCLKVTELMLAMQSTEPYFMSEGREPVSGGNTGAAPVPRRCRQAVQVQSQPVHWDLQLRRVVVNPRALPHRRSQQKSFLTANEQKQCGDESSYLSKNNSSNSSSSSDVSNWGDDEWICSKFGPRCPTGLDRLDTFASILQQQKESQAPNKTQPRRKQHDKHQEQPSTIAHWIRLGCLPQLQKPNVARVRLVLNNDIDCGNCNRRYRPTGSRYRTKKRIINSNSLNWNVSHCAETVDNPSLIPVSDSEQQMSQSRLTTQPTSWDLDGNNTASTVTANSISCDCLSTFDAATVGSQSIFDFKLEPKLFRQASPVQLPPVLEAFHLPYPTYLYCTCAIVETSSNGPHCQSLVKRNCHPKIGFSHLVYYMPNVTIFRRNVVSGSLYSQQQKKRRAKSVRRDYSGALCKTADSLTLLVACELIVPTKTKPLPI